MPPVALAPQDRQRLGDLGPGHGVRDELHDRRRPARAGGPQPCHQLHVLADRSVQVAAGDQDGLLLEQPEGARDDQVAPQAVPAEPAEQERPQVLHVLHPGQPGPGSARRHDPPLPHLGPVDDPDRAPHRQAVGAVDERADHPQQCVVLDDRVGVDGADQVARADVEPGVERVGLAAVVLVHHEQVGLATAAVDAPHVAGVDPLAVDDRHRHEVELLDQPLQRRVRAAVVDDHDLQSGVGQGHQ